MCLLRWPDRLNCFPHTSHLSGHSPVWIIMCVCYLAKPVNSLSHWQELLSPVCSVWLLWPPWSIIPLLWFPLSFPNSFRFRFCVWRQTSSGSGSHASFSCEWSRLFQMHRHFCILCSGTREGSNEWLHFRFSKLILPSNFYCVCCCQVVTVFTKHKLQVLQALLVQCDSASKDFG